MKTKPMRGISLVEVMVAIGILAILVSVALPSFTDLIARRRLQAVTAEIASDLAYARSEAALRPQGTLVLFRQNTSTTCYTIQSGSGTINCDCTRGVGNACPTSVLGASPELKTMQLARTTGITVTPSATNWATANNKLGFQSPQLLPTSPDFGVTISNSNASLRVEFNSIGRVSTCSPNGSFGGGVRTCLVQQ